VSRNDELLCRRAALVVECETQRHQVAAHRASLATPLRVADGALKVAAYLRTHPVAMGASVAALFVAQRRGMLKWGKRALVAWRFWQTWRSGRGQR
jgi:YqjK-like protein